MDNTNSKNKKPFGLALACKIASQALYDNLAPASIILGNLLLLQQSNHFPKELDIHFFTVSKKILSDSEKRLISNLLPEIKKPLFQVPEILENAIKDNWVKKIPLKEDFVPKARIKPKESIKKNFNTNINSKKKIEPVIIIKKNKLTWLISKKI